MKQITMPNTAFHLTAARWRFQVNVRGHSWAAAGERRAFGGFSTKEALNQIHQNCCSILAVHKEITLKGGFS
jgi:hypothetical protein